MAVALHIVTQFWMVLAAMAPYLLFGFLVAGLLSVFVSPERIEEHLGGNGIIPVLKAAAFGVPLPLCSCGVIPVAAGLRRHGASRGATTAFLLSTPQTGVDSILVTYSLLGPVFAVFRPVVALISGVIGGVLVSAAVKEEPADGGPVIRCTDECCNPGAGSGGKLRRALRYGFATLPRDIGKALLVGVAVAALISALVPEDFFARHIESGVLQIVLLMAIGIPVYVCATASVPMAASLVLAGVSPGAALAFLITGPGTNAATVSTVWKVMGKRTAVLYLLTVAITAFSAGLLLDQLVSRQEVVDAIKSAVFHEHSPWAVYVDNLSAVALLAVLAVAIFRPTLGRLGGPVGAGAAGEARKVVTLSIEDMTCGHCVEAVEHALRAQHGVQSAEVSLEKKQAVVSGTDFDTAALCRAVEEAGYKATAGTS